MAVTPFGPWSPDRPDHENPGLIVCKNCISRTVDSYGPFSGFSGYSSGMGARGQGAYTARNISGNIQIFSGDATKLYRLTSASTSEADVSGTAYATPSDAQWRFAQDGERVIAVNGSDTPQSFVMGSSSAFADLSADPALPVSSFVAKVRDFLFHVRLSTDPQAVQWSAQNDSTSYPTIGSPAAAAALSDARTLRGDGGWNQGVVSGLGLADVAIVQERAMLRGTFLGAPGIFQFDFVEGARGTPSPGSIVPFGAFFAYLGEDGWYLFDGVNSTPIGADLMDKTFFSLVNQTYLNNISGCVDPINKVFYWAFPSSSGSGGLCDMILSWNWNTKRSTLIELDEPVEYIFRAGTFGYNLDNAASTGWNVDTSPFGPDSRFWTGGRSILAGYGSADHNLGFFAGDPLEAQWETGDLDLGQGQRIYMSGVRLIANGGSPTVSVGYRNTPEGTVTYTTATTRANDGFCPAHISSRYQRIRATMPAGSSWSQTKGFEPRFKPEGFV